MAECHGKWEIDWTSTICLLSELLGKVSLTYVLLSGRSILFFMHLSNVLLSELISNENFIGHKVDLLCNGAIKPFWFSSKVLNKKLYLYIERWSLLLHAFVHLLEKLTRLPAITF